MPKHAELLRNVYREAEQSARILHLTANENVMSNTATELVTSSLYGRYHLGNANKRVFAKSGTTFMGLLLKGLPAVHDIEQRAHLAAARLFDADYTDFRPLSGVHAIIATIAAVTEPADRVYCLHPDEGGHFATAPILERMG